MKKTFIILLLPFLVSCNDSDNDVFVTLKEPYEVCKLLPEVSNEHIQVEYCKFYDKDSSLIRKGFYSNGTAVKWHEFYNKGSLIAKREYLQAGFDSSILNRVYIFDKNGDTNYNKSNFYTIELEKDTFNIGDSINLKVKFDAPLYKNSKAEIQLKDNDNKSWILPINREKISFTLVPHFKGGEYKIQGNLIEYLIKEDSSVITRKLIIYKKYNVRS